MFMHYHPAEQTDAEDTKAYIAKVAPKAQVELCAQDLRDEKGCLEMVEKVKKWSPEIHVLYASLSRGGSRAEEEGQQPRDTAGDTRDQRPCVGTVAPCLRRKHVRVYDGKPGLTRSHSIFYLTKNILPMMPWGGSIIMKCVYVATS